MSIAVLLITLGAIFVVELPDKTFIATLVLATRYRPLMVWLGVGTAFLVQTVIAVAFGQLTTLLPDQVLKAITLVIFLAGAVLLARTAPNADAEEAEQEEEYAARAAEPRTGLRAAAACFLVLFAAEWGDLSQLLTVSLVGRYHQPVAVFLGAWGALLAVSGLAVLLGRWLLARVRLSVIHYVGAAVCLVLGVITAVELVRALSA